MIRRKNRMRRAIALLAMLTAAACRSEQAVGGEERAARVGELLYVQNLIADSAVSAKMMAYSAAVDGRGVPADSVLPELHAWLEAWAAAHPESVARAGLMPRTFTPDTLSK
jgi:hypothetical protein